MNLNTISVLLAAAALWLGGKIFEAYIDHFLQDYIAKPSTSNFFAWLRSWKLPENISDNQLIKAFYIFQIVLFGAITLNLTGGTNFDWFTRLAILSCASTTFVSVMFLCLVSANVRAK